MAGVSTGARWRIAILVAFVVVAVGAALPKADDLCGTWRELGAIEERGTVADFGPALDRFVVALEERGPSEVALTGRNMATTWDELVTEYDAVGGDLSVRLQVDGRVPTAIGGLTAQWRESFDPADGRELYAYAAQECDRS